MSVLFAVYDDYMKNKFSNYEARREDLNTLSSFARQFENTEEFLSQLALIGAVETPDALGSGDGDTEKVTLSTIHQAKGLEWKAVFLIWLTEGMFPSSRSSETPEGLEEERRLFYVGVTRCKDELYLTYPDMRLNARATATPCSAPRASSAKSPSPSSKPGRSSDTAQGLGR